MGAPFGVDHEMGDEGVVPGLGQAQLDEPADAQRRRRRATLLLEQLDAELDDTARARLLDEGDLYDEAGLPA